MDLMKLKIVWLNEKEELHFFSGDEDSNFSHYFLKKNMLTSKISNKCTIKIYFMNEK
jgi:hypothetical protein